MKKLCLLFLLSLGITSLTNASELLYECTINNLYKQTDSGEIKLITDVLANKIFKGHRFTISKKTGLMSGYFDISEINDSRVLTEGSSGSSFKAMLYNEASAIWMIVDVQTNSMDEEQPFKISYFMSIYTGLCK